MWSIGAGRPAAVATPYALATNPFDIRFTSSVTYSESNLRATWPSGAGVAKLLVPRGIGSWAIEFEIVVQVGNHRIGALAVGTQTASGTNLGFGATDIGYSSAVGQIIVNNSVVASAPTFNTNGDKITLIYGADAGTMEFWKNGSSVYSGSGYSGGYIPAAECLAGTTGSIRVSSVSSYTLPTGVLFWR